MIEPVVLWAAVLLPALAALSWIDMRTLRLPDVITLPLIITGMAQWWYFFGDANDAAIGAMVGYLFFVGVEVAYRRIRGRDGLGRGDAKLLAAGGAWCGWADLPLIVLVASGAACVFVLAYWGVRRRPIGLFPFGPFLALGIASVWLMVTLTDWL